MKSKHEINIRGSITSAETESFSCSLEGGSCKTRTNFYLWFPFIMPILSQCASHLQVEMRRLARIVVTLRNNPRYLCKYLVWTNILVVLYFVINVNTNTNIDQIIIQNENQFGTDGKESGAPMLNEGKYKFEHFELSKWNETQHFHLTDSDGEFFT